MIHRGDAESPEQHEEAGMVLVFPATHFALPRRRGEKKGANL